MTKQQELAILDQTIAQLGPDSYLGPWLTQVRAEVESNIRSDYFPSVSLKDSQDAAADVLKNAVAQGQESIARAEKFANERKKEAQRVLNRAISAVAAAERELQKF